MGLEILFEHGDWKILRDVNGSLIGSHDACSREGFSWFPTSQQCATTALSLCLLRSRL